MLMINSEHAVHMLTINSDRAVHMLTINSERAVRVDKDKVLYYLD